MSEAADGLKATPYRHRDCGGVIVASLDGESCARCGAEITDGLEIAHVDERPWPYDGAKGRARLTGNVGTE